MTDAVVCFRGHDLAAPLCGGRGGYAQFSRGEIGQRYPPDHDGADYAIIPWSVLEEELRMAEIDGVDVTVNGRPLRIQGEG